MLLKGCCPSGSGLLRLSTVWKKPSMNKGGHRVAAIKAIDSAINHINEEWKLARSTSIGNRFWCSAADRQGRHFYDT